MWHTPARLVALFLVTACKVSDEADGLDTKGDQIIENIFVIGDSIVMGAGAIGAGSNCELGPESDSLEAA